MRHGSLFSGIGGFDLAAEWMGWENVFHCEWNEFGQKILHHYWPNAIQYNDITKTDFTIHRGCIDILTGGFPCQPYSTAGKRKGKEDERHLWPEMLRAIREIQPRWVVGENVLGLVNWNGGMVFDEVQADLEAAGYEVWPYVLPAVSVGAPHRRDRIWFVAFNTKSKRNTEVGRICERQNNESIGICSKITPHPNRNGLNQRNGNDEEQPGERGFNALGNADTGNEYGDAADTNRIRLEQRENTGEMGRGQAEMGGQGREFTNAFETDGKVADVTHSHRDGFNQRNGNDEEQPGERGFNALGNADTGNEYGDAADSGLLGQTKRQQQSMGSKQLCEERDAADSMLPRGGKDNRRGKSKFFDENGKIGNWETFPTQSPVCSGDDGIPTKLDGITFSKWRNESIKGYGNAIVPQVVYQIFKAIEEYESLKNTHGSRNFEP
jgi:DNA (cytosine-5)-methyltransferase 1